MHVSLRDSPEQLVVKHFVNAFGPDSLIKAQAFKTRTAKAFARGGARSSCAK